MTNLIAQAIRLFLGAVFLTAGVNGFFVAFGFEPFLATSPAAMALFTFDYLLIVEKSLEILCGFFLLFNRFIPLVLAVLSPIIMNILLLHLFLDHSLLFLATVLFFAHSYLLFCYKENFKPLLKKQTKPFR